MTRPTPFDQTEPPPPSTSMATFPDAPSTASTFARSAFTDRRGVLAAAIGLAGAGALAACSSPPIATEAPASSVAASSTAAATSEPEDDDGGASATPAPAGTPTSDIPVGGGKIYPDQQVVVTQPTAGQFKAFSAICTHQGCTVGQIEAGEIICPCHSSHFSIATGAPTADSLAQSPLPEKSITVTGNTFSVT